MVHVEVVYCPVPGQVDLTPLQLADGSTVSDALQASAVLERHGLAVAGLAAAGLETGVWFKLVPADTVLRDKDRVELYRPLTVDPKEARRLRYRKREKPARGISGIPTK